MREFCRFLANQIYIYTTNHKKRCEFWRFWGKQTYIYTTIHKEKDVSNTKITINLQR